MLTTSAILITLLNVTRNTA